MHPHLLNASLAVFFLAIFCVVCGTFSRYYQRRAAYLPLSDQAHALSGVYPIETLFMGLILAAFGLLMKFFTAGEVSQSQQAVAFFALAAGCITLMFWLNSYYAKKYHTIWADPSFNWW